MFQNINKDSGIGKSYNSDFMEMDGTYKHNIIIPLMSTYGAEPKSICSVNEYIGDCAETNPYAWNQFEDLLEACDVASALSKELIYHLTFHSNHYENCHDWDVSVPWYHIEMTLISSDIDGFESLWYSLTHVTISPTCQFEIKHYPS